MSVSIWFIAVDGKPIERDFVATKLYRNTRSEPERDEVRLLSIDIASEIVLCLSPAVVCSIT